MSEDTHEHTLRVRYQETDQMGVVHHASYLGYFEVGRTEWLRDRGMAYSALEEEGVLLAVTEAGCRYISSMRYDDPFVIETHLADLKKSRMTFRYRVRRIAGDDRTLVAEGFTTLACLDGDRRPRRIPDHVRRLAAGEGGRG